MDESLTTHLDRVRAKRAELGEAMAALDDALAHPVAQGGAWRGRVRAALTELAHDLQDHVALTEAPDGLYADLRERAPRLSRDVEAQVTEHAELLAEIERLLTERDVGIEGPDAVRAHREAATVLLGRLARHRQHASDLIFEAYDVDLGGSG